MQSRHSSVERLLSLFTAIHPGEGRAVLLLVAKGYLLLLSYYLLKPVREALILTEGSAELRSYAVALQAAVLLVVVPLYSVLFQRTSRVTLIHVVTIILCTNLVLFYLLGNAGWEIGFVFFVWLGIFSVLIVAQFWAFAADLYSVESGQRLFVVIAVGASLGAWSGSLVAKALFAALGSYGLMLLACAVLLATLFLSARAEAAVPEESSTQEKSMGTEYIRGLFGGFRIVWNDGYLKWIALFVVLLNWVNTTGEYILAKLVILHAETLIQDGTAATKGTVIGQFYGEFYAWVNVLSLAIQLFFVYRVYRLIGIRGALWIAPVLAFLGYATVAALPIFAVILVVKVIENSVDYSLQNTTRHALFLPTSREAKYAGKTTIDTLLWRIGDLVQAGAVYVGSGLLGLGVTFFAGLNTLLAALWILVVTRIRAEHRCLTAENQSQPIK
jgi:ATP:ADP antiporter, AAA family